MKVYTRESADVVAIEAKNQTYAKSLGLPVPAVIEQTEIDGKPALVMEHVSGKTMLSAIESVPESVSKHLARSVEIQRSIHAVATPELRPMSDRLAEKIHSVSEIEPARKQELLQTLNRFGSETQLCHGDFHVLNVILSPNGPAIIDWMDATRGNPLVDACRTYVLYAGFDVAIATLYIDEFCRQCGTAEDAVLTWQPVIAAARLSEGVDKTEREWLMNILSSTYPAW